MTGWSYDEMSTSILVENVTFVFKLATCKIYLNMWRNYVTNQHWNCYYIDMLLNMMNTSYRYVDIIYKTNSLSQHIT
jgi:hypothetical protein